jgi:hypothetical protein
MQSTCILFQNLALAVYIEGLFKNEKNILIVLEVPPAPYVAVNFATESLLPIKFYVMVYYALSCFIQEWLLAENSADSLAAVLFVL